MGIVVCGGGGTGLAATGAPQGSEATASGTGDLLSAGAHGSLVVGGDATREGGADIGEPPQGSLLGCVRVGGEKLGEAACGLTDIPHGSILEVFCGLAPRLLLPPTFIDGLKLMSRRSFIPDMSPVCFLAPGLV